MRTRQQITNQIIRDHEAAVGGPDAYSTMIKAELNKRLTEATYLTCENFDHFDLQCCTTCHGEPHFEMADVLLADEQHAWVCCHVRDILIRQTKKPPSPDPDRQRAAELWADDGRAHVVFENGDSERLMLTKVGEGLYRLEESSFAGEAMYGDTIHADAAPNDNLVFHGVAERSVLKSQSWVLSAELIESEPIKAILSTVMEAGGMWERAFGGVLLIHTPPALADAISGQIRAANPKSGGCV